MVAADLDGLWSFKSASNLNKAEHLSHNCAGEPSSMQVVINNLYFTYIYIYIINCIAGREIVF